MCGKEGSKSQCSEITLNCEKDTKIKEAIYICMWTKKQDEIHALVRNYTMDSLRMYGLDQGW